MKRPKAISKTPYGVVTAIRELGLYKRLFRNSVDGLLYLLMMMMFNVISLLGIRKERTREIAQKVIHQSNSRLKSEGNQIRIFKNSIFSIFTVLNSQSSASNSDNNVEVNFNIHVISTTGEAAKTTTTAPMLTITSSGEPTATNNSINMTNAQQSAMSNMFKTFFK